MTGTRRAPQDGTPYQREPSPGGSAAVEAYAAPPGAIRVNGRDIPLADVAPHTTALQWLREQGFTGCKEGCGEGECGACAVLVARPGVASPTEWVAVNACLVPVAALDAQEVVTAEGLGDRRVLAD